MQMKQKHAIQMISNNRTTEVVYTGLVCIVIIYQESKEEYFMSLFGDIDLTKLFDHDSEYGKVMYSVRLQTR